jgi:hypothetical protein
LGSAILGSLVGALAGGIASYYVQKRGYREQRDHREAEGKKLLEERLVTFVMTTQRIMADMQNIVNLIDIYKSSNPADSELWQVVHTIHFTPGINLNLSYLESVARLRSATLLNASMHLYNEYQAVVDRVSYYNSFRDRYLERRRTSQDLLGRVTDERNMQNLVEFIEKSAREIVVEAARCQQLVYRHSVLRLGSGEFLKLKNDDDLQRPQERRGPPAQTGP